VQPRVPAHFQVGASVFNGGRGRHVCGFAHLSIPAKLARWHHLEQAIDDPAGMDRDCYVR
jgi:hypothetical protein